MIERATRLAIAGLLLASTACFRGTLPANELYRLVPPEPSADGLTAAADAPLRGSLAVIPYSAPGVYGLPNVVYRTDSVHYGTYPSREWAVPLGTMLGDLTEHVLRTHPLSTEPAVFDPPSRRDHGYSWRGRVREFDEVDGAGVVTAVVALDATLSRAADDSVLWTGSVRRTRVVATPTMSAIVKTLSDLASEAVTAMIDEAATAARRRPATVARPQR